MTLVFPVNTNENLGTESVRGQASDLNFSISCSSDSETLVEVAGIEPETPCAKSPVSMQDSDFSPEALTEILTEISGTDRQMLSQIVKRWGSLSNELKRAVLRLVG